MNGELAALIAVVMHGNAWVAEPSQPPPSLERGNTTFRYVQSLTFVQPRQGLFRRERQLHGTAKWFAALGNEGSERLTLYIPGSTGGGLAPHLASAFANGVPNGLVVHGLAPSLWSSRWETSGAEHPRGEIWRVTMTSHRLAPAPMEAPAPTAEALADLVTALDDARTFARANGLPSWSEWFAKALAAAEAPDPEIPYNPDIAPKGWLDLGQRQLLAAAVQSWVFGGMGSWNDVWLEDESQTEKMGRVTERLYRAVVAALVTVADRS